MSTLPSHECRHCGHSWVPRKPESPVVCPKCRRRKPLDVERWKLLARSNPKVVKEAAGILCRTLVWDLEGFAYRAEALGLLDPEWTRMIDAARKLLRMTHRQIEVPAFRSPSRARSKA